MAILEKEDQGPITRLTLNTPEKLNALSDAMLVALEAELRALRETPTCRVIVLAARGKAFCAGHDLKEMQAKRGDPDGGVGAWSDLFNRCATVMQLIVTQPQPVIAEVQGIATAAGCQLVATCDLAVAAQGVRFGVNGVNIGLFCSTPMVALSRNIPRKMAFEMLTTGDFIQADRAQELGLVNRVVAADALTSETMALADQIAGKLGSAVRIGKEAFYHQLELPLSAAYRYTGEIMVDNMAHPDTGEGISAFLDKRDPDWTQ
ncbi:MAG: enoyl-CoA hydratase [Shimia sp.]